MQKFPSHPVYSPKRPPPAPRTYSITELARIAGLPQNLLRAWEYRYGWPNPVRNPTNQYRIYRQWDVDNATRIVGLIKAGWTIGQLLKDGQPVWPRSGELPPKQGSQRLPAAQPTNVGRK